MTNYEKYKDLVISCVLHDSICGLAYEAYEHQSCDGRTCGECCEFVAEWLNREYNETRHGRRGYPGIFLRC